jgi:DMSO reductase iron-sulfur subunit
MFEVRPDEPGYAKLYDPTSDELNRYGDSIVLTPEGAIPVSLRINHEDAIGTNPNRNKQHGFHFTADNCIGCHACESACSEKNDLPAHLAFRSVGYVEGGSFPDYTRTNISMACNHCDDPVCLKGCPTRAYTKHAEYGAVIQDPDICFGCGYCTWVCPYNAPQLDPVKGRVEKCNMCVDRLEVGLKPACVSACVGNALDFGVIENTPQNREEINTSIPGFPSPDITHPNIRFQLTKPMPDEVTRTDSAPIKYQKDANGVFRSVVDQKQGKEQHWNLTRLSSRENPLVLFTLSVQAALGIFFILTIGSALDIHAISFAKNSIMYLPLLIISLGLTAFGLLMSVTHLGKPWRFYRGYNNWRHSPVCREGLGITFFLIFVGLHLLTQIPTQSWVQALLTDVITFPATLLTTLNIVGSGFALLGLIAGGIGLYYMYRCYRIPARPFWNHLSTGTHFIGNTLTLGSLIIMLAVIAISLYSSLAVNALLLPFALIAMLGIAIEAIGFIIQAKELNVAIHEGAASHYIQTTTFGKTYYLRNGLLAFNSVLAIIIALNLHTGLTLIAGALLTAGLITSAIIGRALFYVLVVPTTMPGAFFWKNKAFEEHARDIGLDHNPNSGVVPLRH